MKGKVNRYSLISTTTTPIDQIAINKIIPFANILSIDYFQQ